MGRYKSNFDDEDIKNLKQIVSLYDQLAKVQKNCTQYTELHGKISDRLSNLNIKNLSTVKESERVIRETYEQVLEIERIEQNRMKAQEKTNDLVRKYNNMWNIINDEQFEMKQRLFDLDEKRLKLAKASNIADEEKERRLKEIKQEYEDINKILNKEKSIKDARKNFKESVVGAVFGTSSQDIKDVENGTYLLNTAAKIFSKAVETFKSTVKEGIDKNYNASEQYYNSIVASNSRGVGLSWSGGSFGFGGKSYSGYRQINNAIKDQLSTDGLYNNISNVDVMSATSVLTSSGGLGLETAIAKAYQDTVIKYIVPYLDTSSETFTTLEYLLPGISKNVAATAIDIKAQLGENQYVAKYSNQLVELMQPVALQANQSLYSEQYSKIAMEAEKYVAAGVMSPATAQKMVNEAFQAYMDPSGTLNNGSTLGKMSVANAIATGNIDNPASYVTSMFGNSTRVMSWGGGNSLNENVIMNSMGGVSAREINLDKLGNINNNASASGYEEQLEIYREQVGLADDMNTTQNKIEVTTSNIMADVGDIKTFLSDKVWGIGEVIVNGITAYLGAQFLSNLAGSNIGKWLSGTATSSATTSTLASTAGGILAVGGGIALGFSAAKMIAQGIDRAKQGSAKENKSQYEQQMLDSGASATYAASTAKVGGLARAGSENEGGVGGFFHNWGQGISQVMDTIGYEAKSLFGGMNATDKTLHALNTLTTTMDISGWSAGSQERALWTFAMLADSAGLLSGELSEKLNGLTRQDIKDYMKETTFDEKYFNDNIATLQGIKDVDGVKALPWSSADKQQTTIDWDNYHRYGLNTVPYDNYMASLHEGEAVLTSATANELRNLITEYRDTTTQAISFDAIIQAQTATLVTKFDEVVSAIKSTGGGITTINAQTKAIDKLNHSMTHLTSTKGI